MMAITAGMDMADIGWEMKCREEDLKQRALENERRSIDDARRSVDEKAEQLKALGQQSALIAGFAMVVMVEASIPEDLNEILLVLYGASASMVRADDSIEIAQNDRSTIVQHSTAAVVEQSPVAAAVSQIL